MVTARPEIKFTYADYRNAPEDKRYELLDGELVVSPAPKEIHQRVLGNLYVALRSFVRERGGGRVYLAPFDVVLTDTDVVQPDLLFVSNERAGIVTEDNAQGAPDLVIEILSPSTADRDLTFKRSLYARHGVVEYWVVDPEARTIEVLALGEDDFERAQRYVEGHVSGVGRIQPRYRRDLHGLTRAGRLVLGLLRWHLDQRRPCVTTATSAVPGCLAMSALPGILFRPSTAVRRELLARDRSG